jgi:hypothetical protein
MKYHSKVTKSVSISSKVLTRQQSLKLIKTIFEADPNSFFQVYDSIIGEETMTNSEFFVINMLDNFRYLIRSRTQSLKVHLQPIILRILKCLDPNKYELRRACHEYVKNTLRSILHR